MEENLYERSVTQYCERVGDYFFAEPINAVSNIAFLIAGVFIFRELKKHHIIEKSYWTLLILILLIGMGSFLWHTFATPITHVLDAGPIWIFFLVFLYQLFMRLTGSIKSTLIALFFFALIQVVLSVAFPEFLNGSIRHVANGLVFAGIGVWFYRKFQYVSRNLVIAFSSYLLAVTFRTIDAWSCTYFSLGTHFLWHLLNAVAVYFAMKLLIELKTHSDHEEL